VGFVDLHSTVVPPRRNSRATMPQWYGASAVTLFTFNALINGYLHLNQNTNVRSVGEPGNLKRRMWWCRSQYTRGEGLRGQRECKGMWCRSGGAALIT
jgi:hypothetical protein